MPAVSISYGSIYLFIPSSLNIAKAVVLVERYEFRIYIYMVCVHVHKVFLWFSQFENAGVGCCEEDTVIVPVYHYAPFKKGKIKSI